MFRVVTFSKLVRIKSATLVETIVAMVIILVIFSITTTVLVQTNKVSFSTKKIKADYVIDQFAEETGLEKSFFDDEKNAGTFTIQKRISENSFSQKVVVVRFSAMDKNGELISAENRIFKIK
jgi:hypothetical protein